MGRVPTSIARWGEGVSFELQTSRAVEWLRAQPGGEIVVVTPRSHVESAVLKRLISVPGVRHHSWRGFHPGGFDGQRVLYVAPDRQRLNDIWGVEADAIAVVEWGTAATAEWIDATLPLQLLPGGRVLQTEATQTDVAELADDVAAIIEYLAVCARGYDSGLQWNEIDKLKADMMNRPDRWVNVTVAQVRAKCWQEGMTGRDADAVSELLQKRIEGRQFDVRSSYRNFSFR